MYSLCSSHDIGTRSQERAARTAPFIATVIRRFVKLVTRYVRRHMTAVKCLVFSVPLILAQFTVAQTVIFVNAAAPDGGDGLSWETAYSDLQDALDDANSDEMVNELWLASGQYKPDRGTQDRAMTFNPRPGLSLLGGFSGNEVNSDQRDPTANPTTITGDLNDDDEFNFINYDDNSFNIVTVTESGEAVTFDGLILTGGNDTSAFGSGDTSRGGGAIRSEGGTVVIINCTFRGNSTGLPHGPPSQSGLGDFGGAVHVRDPGGSLTVSDSLFENNQAEIGGALSGFFTSDGVTLTNCVFQDNFAQFNGGAIRVDGGDLVIVDCRFEDLFACTGGGAVRTVLLHSVVIRDSQFINNESIASGGAILLERSDNVGTIPAIVENCLFRNNLTFGAGGAALYRETAVRTSNCTFLGNIAIRPGNNSNGNGGAILTTFKPQEFVNCLFAGNSAKQVGGVWVFDALPASFVNCTFVNNESIFPGVEIGGLFGHESVVIADNLVLWNNGGTTEGAQVALNNATLDIEFSLIQGITGIHGGVGNIGDDPLFANALGPDGVPGTSDDDLRPTSGSPAIDAGNNLAVPNGVQFDLDGKARFVDDPAARDTGMGEPPIVDMGAYEFHANVPGDLDGDGTVGASDLLILLVSWGPCANCDACNADLDGNCTVGASDLLILLSNWG